MQHQDEESHVCHLGSENDMEMKMQVYELDHPDETELDLLQDA